MPTAFSYLRFSTPQQAAGDSLRRQKAERDAWLKAHLNVSLDTTLKLTDAGKGAFDRKDWETYALAGFKKAIEWGSVKPGDYLLVENLDRLSREEEGIATELFLSIVNKGVVIVQLSPEVIEFRKPVDMVNLMRAVMELSRGYRESLLKSERVGKAWAKKKREAASTVVTRRVPGWIKYDEATQKLSLDDERVATVRRIFDMAIEGAGVHTIAKTLNAEAVPVLGRKLIALPGQYDIPKEQRKTRAIRWNETVVYHILTTPTVHGEYQPHKGRGDRSAERKPVEGAAVPNYYPQAVTRETFERAAAALASRAGGKFTGRRGKHVNLFAGLLVDARDGGSLTYRRFKGRSPAIIPVGAKQGTGAQWSCFPATPFDEAVLGALREVTVTDVEGESEAAKTAASIAGRIAHIDAQIRLWTGKMSATCDETTANQIVAKLDDWNAARRELVKEQATAEREAANPLAADWDEARGLLGLLVKDPSDEMRSKVRAALRRAIESIHCLFTGLGRLRIAAVRVQFRGRDRYRTYYIGYEPGRSNHRVKREGRYEVFTDTDNTGPDLPHRDLRQPGEVAAVEQWLHGLADAINTPCENDPTDTVGLIGAIRGVEMRFVSVSRTPCE